MNVCDFFSSPIGLGHVTRDIAIVNNLEGISINFVTGSGAAQILRKLDYKIDDVYNPPSFIVENGMLNNQTKWLWNYFQYYKNCKKISEKIIKINNSDLIISDEDFASLTVAQNLKIPNILITDVLETKFTKGIASLIERKMNKSMMNIIKNCDVVITKSILLQPSIQSFGAIVVSIPAVIPIFILPIGLNSFGTVT